MRSDTKIGNISIGVKGQNANRASILEYMKQINDKEKQLGVKGVAIVYWNKGKFCSTYEKDEIIYLIKIIYLLKKTFLH